MRISDWSSDVCSSDLHHPLHIPEGLLGIKSRSFMIHQGSDIFVESLSLDGDSGRDFSIRHNRVTDCAGIIISRAPDILPASLDVDVHQEAGKVSRSEEHTSELQSLMRISYAVFCLKKQT